MSERKELLLCPFCGGKAKASEADIKAGFLVTIDCTQCGASNSTIDAWNSRSGPAATPLIITDAMCEAAVKVDHTDHIQGFTYKTHHVIRDVRKDFAEQKIWEINKDDADAEAKFYFRCRIEHMRVVLAAALTSPEQEGGR